MSIRAVILIAALAAASGAAASPQRREPPPICSCDPPPQPRPLPSEDALALARKLVIAVDDPIIWTRVNALVARAEQQDRRPPPSPSRAIRAMPGIQPIRHFGWTNELHQRAVDHAALAYASRFSVEELRQLVGFFESPTGAKFLTERDRVQDAMRAEFETRDMDDDFLEVVCRRPLPGAAGRGEHGYVRPLHPLREAVVRERVPAWCGSAR